MHDFEWIRHHVRFKFLNFKIGEIVVHGNNEEEVGAKNTYIISGLIYSLYNYE